MKKISLLVSAFVVFGLLSAFGQIPSDVADRATYLADIKTELTKEWPKNRSITLLFQGHSVPAGYFKTPVVNTLGAYPQQLLVRLKERYPFAVINVLVTAVGGENSEQGAARFEADVLPHKPDVLFIDYALNDRRIGLEKARQSWQTMIERAQQAGIKVILLTPTPDLKVDMDNPDNELNRHADKIRQLAARYHTGLVDSYRAFDAVRQQGDTLSRYMAQGNHPNEAGHRLVADELVKWFEPEQDSAQTHIYPGQEWKDTAGNAINAHGAGMYYEKGFYYWYGEHKFPGSSEQKGAADGGMHCYRSRDLVNWTDFGVVLPVDKDNPDSDIAYGCIFQRPKVVYNQRTRKYVAYFKLFLKGAGYAVCHTGVATADRPTGPFTYAGKFLAASEAGTGDFVLFQEPNGDLYHFAVRKTDRLMVKAKMADDYLKPATEYAVCPGITKNTEAPAMLFHSGTYHLLGSGSSGWKPNAARYFTSTSLDGPWTDHGNPTHGTNPVNGLDSTKTFGGQSTYILPVQGADNQYIALFDDWKPSNPIEGRYLWLPFRVEKDRISIDWVDRWDLGWFGWK